MHVVKITAVITSPRLLVKHTQLSSSGRSSNSADSAPLGHTQTNSQNGRRRKIEKISSLLRPSLLPL
jgi:hypothetical protein